jgi:FtsH-binding integral membrane protein
MYDPNTPIRTGYGTLDTPSRDTSLLDRVLGWLALSLVLTAGGVYGWQALGMRLPWFLALIVMIGLIFAIQWAVRAGNGALGAALFAVFSISEGMLIAPVVDLYLRVNPSAVGNAVLGTAGIFVLSGGFVWVSNRNFAAWGKWLLGALLIGILLAVVSIFFPAAVPQLFLDMFLGVVFVGLTIFDFWRVKAQRPGDDSALLIALSLYLDFINIFLILLRIFGGRRD